MSQDYTAQKKEKKAKKHEIEITGLENIIADQYILTAKIDRAEQHYRIWFNHNLKFSEGKFIFKKRKTYEGKEWDYKKDPVEMAVLYIVPIDKANGTCSLVIEHINRQYLAQEKEWKDRKPKNDK